MAITLVKKEEKALMKLLNKVNIDAREEDSSTLRRLKKVLNRKWGEGGYAQHNN